MVHIIIPDPYVSRVHVIEVIHEGTQVNHDNVSYRYLITLSLDDFSSLPAYIKPVHPNKTILYGQSHDVMRIHVTGTSVFVCDVLIDHFHQQTWSRNLK